MRVAAVSRCCGVDLCAPARGHSLLFVFFFQAEGGKRDLVPVRGVGDGDKRQALSAAGAGAATAVGTTKPASASSAVRGAVPA